MSAISSVLGAEEFDLDISVVESGPIVMDMIELTGDNCNSTCATACTSCPR